ncbi:MAG: OmpA family protein, partial [Spirochaetaceae bacterium]|nr:OmpA family protein [Spirochaetaceae bacterium]
SASHTRIAAHPVLVQPPTLCTIPPNIQLPAGRGTAADIILSEIPGLIKDALLSIPLDSSINIGDAVLQETLSLADMTNLIDSGKKTPGFFSSGLETMSINHTLSLIDICALLVSHDSPYTPRMPLDSVPSRGYSGIIIDARGELPVYGEYVTAKTEPALFPKIWDDSMNLLYERNMVDPAAAKTQGIVVYSSSLSEREYERRVGRDPLRITARQVYGTNRTDPVISRQDALRILTVEENLELFRQGRVVILLDETMLRYPVKAPVKDEPYYFTYNEITDFFLDSDIQDVNVQDTYKGITISIRDLRFKADSDELLAEEFDRLDRIAEAIRSTAATGRYTILVEGHTASVGKPEGEKQLSVERAQRIVSEMQSRGIDGGLFTIAGYGGTIPLAPNDTPEGMALNRRVELTLQPIF